MSDERVATRERLAADITLVFLEGGRFAGISRSSPARCVREEGRRVVEARVETPGTWVRRRQAGAGNESTRRRGLRG